MDHRTGAVDAQSGVAWVALGNGHNPATILPCGCLILLPISIKGPAQWATRQSWGRIKKRKDRADDTGEPEPDRGPNGAPATAGAIQRRVARARHSCAATPFQRTGRVQGFRQHLRGFDPFAVSSLTAAATWPDGQRCPPPTFRTAPSGRFLYW